MLKKKSPFKGHKTADSEFRALEEKFKEKNKVLQGLSKEITNFLASVDSKLRLCVIEPLGMLTDQRIIVTNIKQVAPESTSFGHILKQEHDTLCSLIEDRRHVGFNVACNHFLDFGR
jgi:hypothetical protein